MKSVLMSIQPKWCERIVSGKKTVEVRKTRPKIETPFKVYIYCTSNKQGTKDFLEIHGTDGKIRKANGKVIGEFVCSNISKGTSQLGSCLTMQEINKDVNGKEVYGWDISNLLIYNEPKDLSEFFHACDKPKGTDCSVCVDCRENKCKAITSPPQSWCYVEERRPYADPR